MSQEKTFSKILESKVDINSKIAKVLANALNWQIDFNAFKSAKQTIMIPIKSERDVIQAKDVTPRRDEKDLFNEIEGRRHDVQLPIITEEKQGATGTGETEQYKLAENYPLRQLRAYNEVLLVSYSDLKHIIEQKLGFRCEDSQMENMAFEKIEISIR